MRIHASPVLSEHPFYKSLTPCRTTLREKPSGQVANPPNSTREPCARTCATASPLARRSLGRCLNRQHCPHGQRPVYLGNVFDDLSCRLAGQRWLGEAVAVADTRCGCRLTGAHPALTGAQSTNSLLVGVSGGCSNRRSTGQITQLERVYRRDSVFPRARKERFSGCSGSLAAPKCDCCSRTFLIVIWSAS
jgi:hypothetical protein